MTEAIDRAAGRRPTRATRIGRHFLQIPGPSNVPDAVLQAMSRPTIDHRGPEFAEMIVPLLDDMRAIFRTDGPVIAYPSSGTGAWEAALVNVLSPGDHVLMVDAGHFASQWRDMAQRLGFGVVWTEADWRTGVDVEAVADRLAADRAHEIRAVAIVHNETSTGVMSDVAAVRRALDDAGHPALLLVDAVSSLGSADYRHADWGVDVTICASQKGFMLPPGLGFNAVSEKALAAMRTATFPRSYWSWDPMIEASTTGRFPYTPPTNMFFGLRAAVDMLLDEGLDAVIVRHARHAAATRAAVQAWGLDVVCARLGAHSNSVTAVLLPAGHDADRLRQLILECFDLSLGTGLGQFEHTAFRVGHVGSLNDLMLAGTLSGVQAGLALMGVPMAGDGVAAALASLAEAHARPAVARTPTTPFARDRFSENNNR